MQILYQIELQMLELGLMFQIKIIGQKIKTIGSRKQNIQKIDFQTDFMRNLQKHLLTKEQVFQQEASNKIWNSKQKYLKITTC